MNDKGFPTLIRDQKPGITYVQNAQEFINYLKTVDPKLNITEDEALRTYEMGLSGVQSADDLHVYWINSGSEIDPFNYYETTKEFADVIASKEIPSLNKLLDNFVNNNNALHLIPNVFSGVVNTFVEKLGISTEAAVVLFLLYEGAQYGLAPFTSGATLALPG